MRRLIALAAVAGLARIERRHVDSAGLEPMLVFGGTCRQENRPRETIDERILSVWSEPTMQGDEHRGRQLAWLDQSGRGVVTVRLSLPAATARTFYDQAGDYVMWAGVAVTALAALVMFGRRRGFLGGSAGISNGREAEYDAETGQPVPS